MSLDTDIESFLASYNQDVRDLAGKVRALIRNVMPMAIEQLDPSANLIGYGVDRTYKGLICGITLHKAHVNLMFAKGSELPDPNRLLTGTGKRARHIKIQPGTEIDTPAVHALLETALLRQKE
ncbi:MAG: DUF1801 domain-containing protein [Acidobacteriota bacterium]